MKKAIISIMMAVTILVSVPMSTSATENYMEMCEEIGDEYGISPEFLMALIESESGGNPKAYSDHGAIGLTQVIPKWNKERIKRLGITDLYDPYQNIECSADLLLELFEKYEDPYLVLMCYNQGEYGTAKKQWESGTYSKYAVKIVERAYELEGLNGKHDY